MFIILVICTNYRDPDPHQSAARGKFSLFVSAQVVSRAKGGELVLQLGVLKMSATLQEVQQP